MLSNNYDSYIDENNDLVYDTPPGRTTGINNIDLQKVLDCSGFITMHAAICKYVTNNRNL